MPNPRRWILLRGLARGRGHWGSFVQKMQAHFPNDEFELIDLKGNGERFTEQSPLHVEDYVRDLRAHSQFVKDGKPFNILAVSLGAMITVEWMREYPHEVQKAILVCTSSSGFSPFYDRYRLRNYLPTLRLAIETSAEKWERDILEMVTNSHERREAEIGAMIEYSKRNPMKVTNILRQLAAASRYRFPKDAPGDIKIIGSHGDRLVSPRCSLKIAEGWGLKAVMHPWAGHDIPVDDPQWLIEHLL
ncbi:alpha/beta fold hydrolase [Bdellovibrio svalbardensis]|uniref:Alpha/beta hydrolase n=1 Tax=Bdellovibrio svalbardensis TaxID=2972972 RepID=A0ABT6DH19_9BACT|nr:alpha/beta hydrolase [Bdellovibrio svalbardensis]MDG0816149.1 alpha/beta hydrolase [Bdellovibrio svalbardensis]